MKKIFIGFLCWLPIFILLAIIFLIEKKVNKNWIMTLSIITGIIFIFDIILATWAFNDKFIERTGYTNPHGLFAVILAITFTVIGTIYVCYLSGKKFEELFIERN